MAYYMKRQENLSKYLTKFILIGLRKMLNQTVNNFAADVLDTLKRRKVTFHGCTPWYLEQMGANVKIWFAGERKGKEWMGGVTIISQDAENALATGDSHILAEICEKIIDDNNARYM